MNYTTHLFDHYRSGRLPYSKGNLAQPHLVWACQLPSYPPHGPESTAVFDKQGNLYFGCHDGCFYSINPDGNVRWSFTTQAKIYSSPTIVNHSLIYFASGDGNLYCLNTQGKKMWHRSISHSEGLDQGFSSLLTGFHRGAFKIFLMIHKILIKYKKAEFYYKKEQNLQEMRCWASPNVDSNGTIYINGPGIGLQAIEAQTGDLFWQLPLSVPQYHLAGVAISKTNDIFCPSQQRYLYCVDKKGKEKWRFDSSINGNIWGSPSVDPENDQIYFSVSANKVKSSVFAVDHTGKCKWASSVEDEIRGSVAVSYEDYVVVCGLNGYLFFIEKTTGKVTMKKQISFAERGLWTTPSIDKSGHIFVTATDSRYCGRLVCLDKAGNQIWSYKTGKVLSTPILDENKRMYIGSWQGEYLCLQT